MTSTAASFDGSDGAKPPSSPWPVAWPSSWRMRAQRREDLGAGAQRLGVRVGADRHDHELLEVGRVLGVLAAVEDVEHRDRQGRARRRRRGSGRAAGRTTAAAAWAQASETPRIAFAPSAPLFGVPSSSMQQRRRCPAWSAASSPYSAGAIVSVTLATALEHALAAVARLVAVAQLDRLVGAGRRARRHGRPADRAVGEDDVDLDRRVAARVEDLARVDDVDDVFTRRLRLAFGGLGLRLAGLRLGPVEQDGRRPAARDPRGTRARRRRRSRCGSSGRPGPAASTAATESPPPTTTVAPASARRRGSARPPCVPWANDGISKTPSGPFQKTVWTSASASTIRSWLALPTSTMCHEAGIFSAGSVLYSVPRVTSLATMTSTGRTTRTPLLLGRRRGSAGRRRRGRARPGSCRPPCPGRAGTCWPCRRRGRAGRPWSAGCRGP